jgi:hypothetical protein
LLHHIMIPPPDPIPDPELRALLRAAHPAPSLPPRFQEGVWRRLERSERSNPTPGWFESFVAGLLRPAYASIGLAAVMVAGVGLGLRDTEVSNLMTEQARYLAAVSPLHQAP